MKKIVAILILLIGSIITYSQGVGYLNYTVYNIYSNGAGPYANNATDFVNMFDTTKGATVYARGTAFCNAALLDFNGRWTASGVPNGGNYTGIKITGWFIPKETGTYQFFINGDDGVDFSLDGKVVTSFYGAHGFGANVVGSVSLVAGKSYAFMARYQNWGGGWGMDLEWKRPSQYNWAIQSEEVTSVSPVTSTPTKKAITNFNFNTNIDATKFSIGSSALSSNGSIDITTNLDSTKVANGYQGAITAGQVEWSYVNIFNGVSTLYIDMRQFGNTTPSSVNNISILDVYSGPITFKTSDATWAQYTVPSTLTKATDGTSTYNSNIRNAGYSNYAFKCNVAFTATQIYKPQSISISTTNNLTTLYNSIVTVSDVYTAFQEYSNQGLFGNQMGTAFSYGIQYQNADVNSDGVFNEADCFLLLQNLTGAKNLVDTFNLNNTLKIIPVSTYNTIGKSNWNTFTQNLGSTYSFDINTGKSNDTLNLAVAWKGDVNLSHSTTPTGNLVTMSVPSSIRSFSTTSNQIQSTILTEMVGDSVYATITLNPLTQQVVGAQYKLNYDNSVLKFSGVSFKTNGNPTNFGVDKGDYVSVGSLITDGSTTLSNTTQYKISFITTSKITNILGLISISSTDAVNQSGTQLNIKIM